MLNKDTVDMDRIPSPHPLPNKPLVEVIFELRWELTRKGPGPLNDPGFRIFLGRYYDQIKKEYPHVQDLPSAQAPEFLTAHTVRHQFWKAKDRWPVTQVGPGIMTINETHGYLWESYRRRLIEGVRALYQSYPAEIAPFKPIEVTLKYLDAVEFDSEKSTVPLLAFIRDNLHTAVEMEPLLFEGTQEREAPVSVNLSVTYPLTKPLGIVTLMIANGTRDGRPSVMWETSVLSKGRRVPDAMEKWETWFDEAHGVMDKWFFALVRGKLLSNFEAEHADRNVELYR